MNTDHLAGHSEPPSEPDIHVAPVIDRAPLPMLEVEGPDHIVCSVNAAFCRLLKKARSELIGTPFSELVYKGANCVPLLDRIYQTGESETHAEPDQTGTDPAYWLYAMWPARDLRDRPVRVVIQLTKSVIFRQNIAEVNEALLVAGLRQLELRESAEEAKNQLVREIAERILVESALREAKDELQNEAARLEEKVTERTAQLRSSMEELQAISYSLVHDLRAPIRAIHGFAQLTLEMGGEQVGPAAVEMLTGVVKAAVRMDSLIKDVLALNEVTSRPIQIESIDVDDLVQSVIKEHSELSAERVEIEVARPLLKMRGHEASLSQCINNLLNNAVKFVNFGTKPQLRIWSERRPEMGPATDETQASTISNGPATVRLWIEDHGIGIAKPDQDKIFQIFQRLHNNAQYEGAGIGLAIVRKAIARMGGSTGVQSTLGKGSSFWLELPGD